MVKYFLVSSQVHLEKNALSEAAWILSELSGFAIYESCKATILPVGGLGLLSTDNDIELTNINGEALKSLFSYKKVFYCAKIIPLEYFDTLSEGLIFSWVSEHKINILPTDTWKININKRHTKIDPKQIIDQIAKNISNQVNLKTPDKMIQIEIIGKYVGLAILKPENIIQLSSYLSNVNENIFDDNIANELDE